MKMVALVKIFVSKVSNPKSARKEEYVKTNFKKLLIATSLRGSGRKMKTVGYKRSQTYKSHNCELLNLSHIIYLLDVHY